MPRLGSMKVVTTTNASKDREERNEIGDTAKRTRVHVLGAGPVGLLMTALLQPTDRFSVHLYEKSRDYSRTRMVQLASYLVAYSVASYCTD
jgi:threonine dehydrogenase-like Zn-dependent dehydrogenase